jgi:hypothetical protein
VSAGTCHVFPGLICTCSPTNPTRLAPPHLSNGDELVRAGPYQLQHRWQLRGRNAARARVVGAALVEGLHRVQPGARRGQRARSREAQHRARVIQALWHRDDRGWVFLAAARGRGRCVRRRSRAAVPWPSVRSAGFLLPRAQPPAARSRTYASGRRLRGQRVNVRRGKLGLIQVAMTVNEHGWRLVGGAGPPLPVGAAAPVASVGQRRSGGRAGAAEARRVCAPLAAALGGCA